MPDPAAEPSSTEADEVKRKFKEALDRKKHQQQHASVEAAEHDGSDKSHGATEPTVGRTFRRKSI